MTNLERDIAEALQRCSFLPGHPDKAFVHQLPNWNDREMTVKGRAFLFKLLDRYRRQIPNYEKLKTAATELLTAIEQHDFFAHGYTGGSASISEVMNARGEQNKAYSNLWNLLKELK